MAVPRSDHFARLQAIRESVRQILTASEDYQNLSESTRRDIARGLVKICSTALALDGEASTTPGAYDSDSLALAQNAGSEFSGVASQKVADTTRAILNAVSFPRFVTELVNGVFKAMLDSSIQQMQAYTELLNNVAASTEGFADANIGPDRARQWLAERYPASLELAPEEGEDEDESTGAARPRRFALRLREGAAMPSEAALRTDLGLRAEESVPGGDPDCTLVPFARRHLAKARQEMLATMVMLG